MKLDIMALRPGTYFAYHKNCLEKWRKEKKEMKKSVRIFEEEKRKKNLEIEYDTCSYYKQYIHL